MGGLATLGDRKDPAASGALLGLLGSGDWSLKKAACEALAKVRAKDSIGPLIDLLQVEEGLMEEVIYKSLVSITGQDFRYRKESWKKWWPD